MSNKSLTESAQKSICIVCTKLATKKDEYVSIIKDILPEVGSQDKKPGLQDMLIDSGIDGK
jgi:hypothetical protein